MEYSGYDGLSSWGATRVVKAEALGAVGQKISMVYAKWWSTAVAL